MWLRKERERQPFYAAATRLIRATMRSIQSEVAQRIEQGSTGDAALSPASQLSYKLRNDYGRIYEVTGTHFAETNYNRLKRIPAYRRKQIEPLASEYFTFYIDQNRFPLITTTTNTVKVFLQNEITRLLYSGLGAAEIASAINAPNLLEWETLRIVRTEVICASNAGDLYGAKATGYDMNKEWIAAMQENTRESHFLADGQTVKLNEPFVMDDGDRLDFPGDNSYGASAENTINCRCSVGYEVL